MEPKTKTVIYAGGFELPDKNAAAHRVVANAKLLRDEGFRVVLVDSCREQTEGLLHQPDCYGFERWSVKKSMKQLYEVKHIRRVMEDNPDTVALILYNYPAVGMTRLRRYCRKKGIKILADATEWYGTFGRSLVYKIPIQIDSFLRMRVIHPRLDGVIAISRYLEDFYKDRTPTLFLPPLTDSKDAKWQIPVTGKDSDTLTMMYAGQPGPDKDRLTLILHTLRRVEEPFVFHIIGLTAEQHLQYNPQDAALLEELGNRVVFEGRRSHREVIEQLQRSDFSVFYRDANRMTMAGFPTKFAEAITAGTPVLTNKTSDLADFLVEGKNGFWIDDLENDLPCILSKERRQLQELKQTVDRELFDYRRYGRDGSAWMNRILEEVKE